MKYANIKYTKNRKGMVNIGDDMQLFAINNLYHLMGIKEEDIVQIDFTEIYSYQGEYCILPISFAFYGYGNELNITNFSPYIIPVFLGLSIMTNSLPQREIEYLKQFEPIGCRDEYTMKILRNYGICAYVNGCLTFTLPYAVNNARDKIYLVDIPKEYEAYIPLNILERAISVSQILEDCPNAQGKAEEYFNMYSKHAALVITSRLHCAYPCVAAGIPVILMKDHFSFRFSALKKYIDIYTKEEFGTINWNPELKNYQQMKGKIISNAIHRISDAYHKYENIYDISLFHELGDLEQEFYIEHYHEVVDFIDTNWTIEESFEYSFWGITQKSELIYQYLKANYPKSKLAAVYDNKKTGHFHGVKIETSHFIKEAPNVFVFVTATTAILPAKQLFKELKRENFYYTDDGVCML